MLVIVYPNRLLKCVEMPREVQIEFHFAFFCISMHFQKNYSQGYWYERRAVRERKASERMARKSS